MSEHEARSVDSLELSVRSNDILQSLKVETVSQLIKLTEEDLKASEHCNQMALKEIKEVLGELGLSLRTK